MAAAEILNEALAIALETTHGTAITNPTHYLNMPGTVSPAISRSRRSQSDGRSAEYARSQITRKTSTWETDDADLDVNTLPVLLEMAVKGGGVVTTPAGATTARLHTYIPTMTSDDLKSATIWWGDPNAQVYQATYCMLDTLDIAADGSSEDAATMTASGWGKFPSKVSAPTYPSQNFGPLVNAQDMQLWMDTGSAIGTTEITGRLISGSLSIPTGAVAKYLAQGPGGDRGFTKHGRTKRHVELNLVFDLEDQTQYDLFVAGTTVKIRWRLNGPAIETITGPVTLYNYFQADVYGPLEFDSWGDLENSNRTISLNVMSEVDSTAGYDFAAYVQNSKNTL
jgi:hypothetical protein